MTLEEKIKTVLASGKSTWVEESLAQQANQSARTKARKVALRVLQTLKDKNWSQAILAEKMQVTRQQVGKIVKGEANFTFETIAKLEKALDIQLITIEEVPAA